MCGARFSRHSSVSRGLLLALMHSVARLAGSPAKVEAQSNIGAHKPKPTNTAPGVIYMLCGATQHSNTDPFDRTSPAIPIGPHWMIIWPFDAKRCGLPKTVRDAGAWVMFVRWHALRVCAHLRYAVDRK